MGNTKKNYYAAPACKREFIRALYPIAVETSNKLKDKGYTLNAIAILSMAAVESNWGEKIKNNMYFEKRPGSDDLVKQLLVRRRLHRTPTVKGYPRILKILALEDGQYKYIVKEWFKAYGNPLDNFVEHFMDIVSKPEYASAVELGTSSKLFITKLSELGYTYTKRYENESDYASKVLHAMQVIDRNLDIATRLPELSVPRTVGESYPSSLV